ncbi:hypothetical protein SMWOGL2_01120 [Sporomusa malonica]
MNQKVVKYMCFEEQPLLKQELFLVNRLQYQM